MKRVITFGEIMLRLSPPGFQRFAQARSFDVVYGGAESNAAVSLANYGLDSAFVTLLPANPIGDAAVLWRGHERDRAQGQPRGHLFLRKGRLHAPVQGRL